MDSELHTLEWSKKHNSFHIQSAELTVEKNLNALLGNLATDYATIMIGTREECETIQRRYRDRLQSRDAHRGPDSIQRRAYRG